MAIKDYRLAVFDMDGVLTQPVSSWAFVHEKLGLDNTPYANSYRAGTLSYIDFLKSDVNLWLKKLGPTSAEIVVDILSEIPLRKGISETIKNLKQSGLKTAIISGGIYWLAEDLGKRYGFDEVYANKIMTDEHDNIIADGIVMVEPKHKDSVITGLQRKFGIRSGETFSVGDTGQDIAMFRNSGLSFAFNPVDPTVSQNATHTVTGNNLSAILNFI